MTKKLEITLTRSAIGKVPKIKRTVKALGLNRPNKSVVVNDNPQVRGMVKAIDFMVDVREFDAE